MNYDEWEGRVTELVSASLQCNYRDAAGIVEAQPFILAQAWGLSLDPNQTASKILHQLN